MIKASELKPGDKFLYVQEKTVAPTVLLKTDEESSNGDGVYARRFSNGRRFVLSKNDKVILLIM